MQFCHFILRFLSFSLSLSFSFKKYIREQCAGKFELNQPARINSVRKKLVNSVNRSRSFPLALLIFLPFF